MHVPCVKYELSAEYIAEDVNIKSLVSATS
ncbi:hypothetical protein AAKU64_001163 [Undibacterium sp. GrIS 1.8]